MRYVCNNEKLTLEDIGDVVKVYNGQKWVMVQIMEGMLLHIIGEFIVTKKQGGTIHKNKKNKKKSKIKKG